METSKDTELVTSSSMVLSCPVLNSYEPIRLAGTWKQYSKKAIPQLMTITFHSATLRNFKCPYHANVMKIFEMVRRRIVRMRPSGSLFVETCRLDVRYLSQVAAERKSQIIL